MFSLLRLRYPARSACQFGLILAVGSVFALGCKSIETKSTADYRTVQASPNRDTKKAAAEHAAALKILDRCAACYHCECVKNAVCNPCKAEQHLNNALIADVRYGPAHNTLGSYYFSQRKLYLAAWEYEYASILMPERPEPLNNLGLLYEEAGKMGRAISMYEEAVDLSPTSGEYLGNLARAHLRQGTSFDEVRYLLEQVVFHDTRPHWVGWAKDQLGVHPAKETAIRTATFEEYPANNSEESSQQNGIEVIAPPPTQGELPENLPELIDPLSRVIDRMTPVPSQKPDAVIPAASDQLITP